MVIGNCCLKAAKLLLCLYVVFGSSCSNLRYLDQKTKASSKPIVQVAIKESDLPLFMEMVQQLNLRPIQIREEVFVVSDAGAKEFWITFQFTGRGDFLVASSKIAGLGMVKAISYQYRE